LLGTLCIGLLPASFLFVCFARWATATTQGQQAGSAGPLKIPYQTLDPHLGYSHIPEYVAYGDVHSRNALRVVALGSSTTDAYTEESLGAGAKLAPNNWPQELARLVKERHVSAQIFNLGIGGYSSNQEVIKLIRDGLLFSPQLVISLSGVNDMGFIWSYSPELPMVNSYQVKLMDYVATANPGVQISLGVKARINSSPVEQWERNIRIMRSISAEFGAKYICFIQPIMGFGDYSPSPREQAILKKQMQSSVHGIAYLQALRDFYRPSTARCKRISYCVDLTEAFKGKTDMFDDARHPNPEGYRVIAEAVFRHLEAHGFLTEK
jgi:lysophospholipase L1-like esterase